jgi:hypothetical protein
MLLGWVAQHDVYRGDYRSALSLRVWVVRALRRVLGDEHPETLMSMNNLAGSSCRHGPRRGAR